MCESDKQQSKRRIVTIKGKPRSINLHDLGLPPLKIGIISSGHGRGHKQVEIEVLGEECLTCQAKSG